MKSKPGRTEHRKTAGAIRTLDKGIVLALVVGAVVVALVLRMDLSGAQAADFPMEVYQGGEVIGGPQVDFADVLGQRKPVVLNFWAGLCPICRAEMPNFQRLHEAYGDDFIMLGVDIGPYVGLGDRAHALAFLEEANITYPTARSLTIQPLEAYGVIGTPATVFITAEGKIFSSYMGSLAEHRKESELIKLLQAGSDGS